MKYQGVKCVLEVMATSKAKAGVASALVVASLATPPVKQHLSEALGSFKRSQNSAATTVPLHNPPMKTLKKLTLLPPLGTALICSQAFSADKAPTDQPSDMLGEVNVIVSQSAKPDQPPPG